LQDLLVKCQLIDLGPFTTVGENLLVFLPLSNYTNATLLHETALSQSPSSYLPSDTHPTVLAGYTAQHALLTSSLISEESATLEIIFNDQVLLSGLEAPFTRGSITINSTSVFSSPIIDPNYISNPLDIQILTAAIRYTRTILQTKAFASLNPVELVPGSDQDSDEEIEAFIKSGLGSLSHHCGTASMLKRELGGVVDERLNVYGIKGLRVVDASVMPMIPAAHLQSTVYAVAEKVSYSLLKV
jgi:hypothetical protein